MKAIGWYTKRIVPASTSRSMVGPTVRWKSAQCGHWKSPYSSTSTGADALPRCSPPSGPSAWAGVTTEPLLDERPDWMATPTTTATTRTAMPVHSCHDGRLRPRRAAILSPRRRFGGYFWLLIARPRGTYQSPSSRFSLPLLGAASGGTALAVGRRGAGRWLGAGGARPLGRGRGAGGSQPPRPELPPQQGCQQHAGTEAEGGADGGPREHGIEAGWQL